MFHLGFEWPKLKTARGFPDGSRKKHDRATGFQFRRHVVQRLLALSHRPDHALPEPAIHTGRIFLCVVRPPIKRRQPDSARFGMRLVAGASSAPAWPSSGPPLAKSSRFSRFSLSSLAARLSILPILPESHQLAKTPMFSWSRQPERCVVQPAATTSAVCFGFFIQSLPMDGPRVCKANTLGDPISDCDGSASEGRDWLT